MKAIEKISAVSQVESRIKAHITRKDVKIGDKLPTEKQLCEELNVGRGTIREAIRLLQAKGLVELVPGRGAFVAQKEEQIGKEDLSKWFRENEIQIKDCIEVRTAIEPLAVKLAMEHCTKRDINKLRSIQDRSIIAAQNNDSATLALCDEQFHTFIVECSKNKLLIDLNRKINYSLTKFRGKTFNIPENIQNFIPAHEAIIRSFENDNTAEGQASMLEHLECVYKDLEHSKNI
jgi:GntR family transcriptional repressor for pyruvate dehydrogenase complex